MTSDGDRSTPNEFEAEFTSVCEEIHYEMLGLEASECAVKLELWEKKHCKNPNIGHAVRNHVMGLRTALAKNPSVKMVNVQGNHNQVQLGDKNTAQSGKKQASGNSNVVVAEISVADGNAKATQQEVSRAAFITNIVIGVVVGLIVVWWCLPQEWSLGPVRFLATVFLGVAVPVMAVLGWWQYLRSTWERRVYIALGSTLLLRSSIPTVVGSAKGMMGLSQDGLDTALGGFFNIGHDDTIVTVTQIVAGIVLIGFAFFTKRIHSIPS